MNKIIKRLILALFLITSAPAMAEGITVNVGDARPGTTTDIDIFLDFLEDYSFLSGNGFIKGFQMSLYLPDEITFIENDIAVCYIEVEEETTEYWDDYWDQFVKIKKQTDGGFLILCYTPNGDYWPNALRLRVKIPCNVSNNQSYMCSLKNIALCNYNYVADWPNEYETVEINDTPFVINVDTDSPQLYTTLSEGTLTLYYDNQVPVRCQQGNIHIMGGSTITNYNAGPYFETLNNPYSGPTTDKPEEVRTVVFDESIATIHPTTLSKWFEGFSSLKEIKGFEYLNTSQVTNMRRMFAGCSSLKEIDISHFDFSSISTNYDWFENEYSGIDYLFADCSNLEKIGMEGLDTSGLKSMEGLFMNCSSLKEIDVSHFDTSNVIYMDNIFANCSSLKEIDVSHFDTSNVGIFDGMFEGCSSLGNLDLSHFDTSSSMSMGRMFAGCSSLNSIDVSHFIVSGCIVWGNHQAGGPPSRWEGGSGFYQMFKNCSSLEHINLFALESENVEDDDDLISIMVDYDVNEMFAGCTSLKEIDLSHFNGNGSSNDRMFADCRSLTSINLLDLHPNKIGEEMFDGCTSLTSVCIPNSVNDIADHAFRGCTALDNVRCDIPTPLEISEETFDHYDGCTLIVLSSAVNDYKTADVWKNFSNIISSRKGDANGDNETDITDVLVIVDYILGRALNSFIFANADLDSNGAIEITDALKVVDIILGRPQVQIPPSTQTLR